MFSQKPIMEPQGNTIPTTQKHYEKLHFSKPYYPTTKTQKTTHIQLLCNYPPKNTMYYIINCRVRKVISCTIVASELKLSLLYSNLYTSYIHMQSTMFDFFKSCIVVTCGNYFRIAINVLLKQQLCYNQVQCAYMRSCHVFTLSSPIMEYICNLFFVMIPIDTINLTTSAPLLKYYYSTML